MALLKDIIAELNTIAGAFTSVNSFYFDEINAINDNRAKQYPCIIVDSRNVNILASEVGRSNMPNKVNYTLKVAFFDVVNKNNTREVNYSNLELIALQFFAEIKRRTEVFNEDFMFVSASTYNGFALDQLHNDNLVQIIFDVQFNAIRNCTLGTFTDMPPPPTTDATVNINGNFFTLIASGGVGNITVRNISGTEVGSNVDGVWVVPNGGDATVENSNASYTDTVESGGTLVLPDITVTDSDGSTSTVPSVTNVVCTPQIKTLNIVIPYAIGDDTSTVTIVANAVGTINTIDTTGLTTVAVTVNSTPVSVPFGLALNDILEFTYDTTVATGIITLTGTYE
jgi:hypothetical protein